MFMMDQLGGSGTTTVAAAYSSAPTITISASGSSTSTSGNIEAGSYTLAVSVSGGTLNNGYSRRIKQQCRNVNHKSKRINHLWNYSIKQNL
jgi:hypothetical protein